MLLDAAEKGNLDTLKKLKSKNYSLTDKNNKGWDALIVAAYYEQFDVCKWLIKNGADPNSINYNGTSVLMYAMTAAGNSNNLKVLNLLIKTQLI